MEKTLLYTKEEARNKAIEWQHWQSNKSLSYEEVLEWNEYFTELANQFDLVDEFMENGVI